MAGLDLEAPVVQGPLMGGLARITGANRVGTSVAWSVPQQSLCEGSWSPTHSVCNRGEAMLTGATEEWQRTHENGWVAEVSIDTDGTYHHRARDTAAEDVVTKWQDTSEDLGSAQRAADELVPAHRCECPRWSDVTAKVLVQAKCAAEHDIAVTFTRRELQDGLAAGTFAFYCPRCDTYRVPTAREAEDMLRRIQDAPS